MLTGELRNKVDQVWNAFWSGGIANPLEVIEQITYLLFLRGLDSDQTREDNKAQRLKTQPVRLYPEGVDARGRPFDELRWSRFKNMPPAEMFTVLSEHVFPFLRSLHGMQQEGSQSAFAHHMRDARFTIPTPALLAHVVDLLDTIPLDDRDTKGDLYEYMLGKIAAAGQNGQFRTPRHIIDLMVALTAPVPQDTICGTASASQLQFIDEIVQHLTEHVAMPAERLYASPFTDIHAQGPDGVFDATRVEHLFSALQGLELQQAVA